MDGSPTDGSARVQASRLQVRSGRIAATGFAKIYWAHIPRGLHGRQRQRW
jgi:hypothetical protein